MIYLTLFTTSLASNHSNHGNEGCVEKIKNSGALDADDFAKYIKGQDGLKIFNNYPCDKAPYKNGNGKTLWKCSNIDEETKCTGDCEWTRGACDISSEKQKTLINCDMGKEPSCNYCVDDSWCENKENPNPAAQCKLDNGDCVPKDTDDTNQTPPPAPEEVNEENETTTKPKHTQSRGTTTRKPTTPPPGTNTEGSRDEKNGESTPAPEEHIQTDPSTNKAKEECPEKECPEECPEKDDKIRELEEEIRKLKKKMETCECDELPGPPSLTDLPGGGDRPCGKVDTDPTTRSPQEENGGGQTTPSAQEVKRDTTPGPDEDTKVPGQTTPSADEGKLEEEGEKTEQCMSIPAYSCREEHCDKDWCLKFDAAAGDTCFWDVEDNICKSTKDSESTTAPTDEAREVTTAAPDTTQSVDTTQPPASETTQSVDTTQPPAPETTQSVDTTQPPAPENTEVPGQTTHITDEGKLNEEGEGGKDCVWGDVLKAIMGKDDKSTAKDNFWSDACREKLTADRKLKHGEVCTTVCKTGTSSPNPESGVKCENRNVTYEKPLLCKADDDSSHPRILSMHF